MLSPTFDLAQYPTGDTIRLLASLLERMTNANDQLNKANITRNGTTEMRRSSSASPLGACPFSSPLPKSSPRTAATTTSSTSLINNNMTKDNGSKYTVFHARSVPSIDIYSYLSRILKYCPCANECFLSLLVYFDRMSKNALAITGQPFTIDSFNIHRLIISGVMVSSKFFSDIFYTNTRYAKVGGLPVSELNRLELEFLQLNEFNISVSISELQRYGDQLLKVGLMEQEMRMLRESSSTSSYTVRHGRSTSLGSTALVRTLDGIENYKQQQHQRKSMDQPSVQQLVDGTSKLYLDDHHLHHHGISNGVNTAAENVKRHSASCIGKQQQHTHQYHQYHPHQQGNKEMYMYVPYTSPLAPPSSSSHVSAQPMPANGHPAMRRMGSMGSLHSLHQSPLAIATATNEESATHQQHYHQQPMTPLSITTPPFFHRPQSRHDAHQPSRNDANQQYRYQQRHSFADWPLVSSSSSSFTMTGSSPPKTRQRHESMGLNGNPKSNGWRAPRQTKSSINLYQQHNSIWANNPPPTSSVTTTTSTTTTSMIPIDPTHQYQYQQQPFNGVPQQQQQPTYHFPNSGNRRRLSLNSVHAPAFIPQRPASVEYTTTNGTSSAATAGSFAYYPVASSTCYQYPIGIPTPPPSSSPTRQQQHQQYHHHHHHHHPHHQQQHQNQQTKSDGSYPYSISSSSSSSSSSHQLYL